MRRILHHAIFWLLVLSFCCILVFAVAGITVMFFPGNLAAVVAAEEPVEPCPLWKTAGSQKIYRCVDEDSDNTCYAPVNGVMQCLKDY